MKLVLSNMTAAVFGMILAIVLIMMLAGCAGTPRWGSWSKVPSRMAIEAGLRRLETYAYYPSHQVYFNAARGEYTFWNGRNWVREPQPPPGVAAELLAESPSVTMRFEDPPERHHAEVSRRFPSERAGAPGDLASLR